MQREKHSFSTEIPRKIHGNSRCTNTNTDTDTDTERNT
nr:MAG TPA: hypothetical protein [Caudoviricetes sp.]